MIRIERADVQLVRLPPPVAFAARTPLDARVHALLRVRGDGPAVGLGEAAPLPGFSSESIESVTLGLESFRERTLPMRLDDGALLSQIEERLSPLGLGPAARFACETAILDLAGQELGRSVAELLSGRSCSGRRVPINLLLPATDDEPRLAALVERGLARGVTTFKMKVGRAPRVETELARLAALRRRFGCEIALRLDANEAWTVGEARRNLQLLAELAPDLVEQPVPREELFRLTGSPVPIAADETLQLDGALERLIGAGVCEAVVLKPAALGGLLAARRLARRASGAGLRVIVTHLMDGPAGVAAAAELALSLDPPPEASGLAEHDGLDSWSVRPPQLGRAAVVAHDRSGLGLAGLEPTR